MIYKSQMRHYWEHDIQQLIIPLTRLHLLTTLSMCPFQLKSEETSTPKYLTDVTCSKLLHIIKNTGSLRRLTARILQLEGLKAVLQVTLHS